MLPGQEEDTQLRGSPSAYPFSCFFRALRESPAPSHPVLSAPSANSLRSRRLKAFAARLYFPLTVSEKTEESSEQLLSGAGRSCLCREEEAIQLPLILFSPRPPRIPRELSG